MEWTWLIPPPPIWPDQPLLTPPAAGSQILPLVGYPILLVFGTIFIIVDVILGCMCFLSFILGSCLIDFSLTGFCWMLFVDLLLILGGLTMFVLLPICISVSPLLGFGWLARTWMDLVGLGCLVAVIPRSYCFSWRGCCSCSCWVCLLPSSSVCCCCLVLSCSGVVQAGSLGCLVAVIPSPMDTLVLFVGFCTDISWSLALLRLSSYS